MVKHVVMWRLKESAGGRDKAQNAALLKEKLEALGGKIPGLLKIEVGLDFSATPDSPDVVLYSELENREALKAYRVHPEHLATFPFFTEVTSEKRVVDYEV